MHVWCRGLEEEDGCKSLLASGLNRLKEMPSDREQRQETVRSRFLVPSTRHRKETVSAATSDTSDIRGPIPLTRAYLQVKSLLSLMFVMCNLAPVNAWQVPCRRSKLSLCFGVSKSLWKVHK